MKKTYLFPFLLLILFFTGYLYSWDSTAAKYFPLRVGNSWTYKGESTFPGPCWTREKHIITGTTVFNGRLYFVVRLTSAYSNSEYYLRIDSTNMNVLLYSTAGCPWSPSDRLTDSLSSRKLDSFLVNCTDKWKNVDTSWQNVFGLNKPSMQTYWYDGFEMSRARFLSKDFGLTKWVNCAGAAGCCTKTLIGCLIDGIIYGDTSLTGMDPISNIIPKEFSVSQNYPNPFNPVTNIEFSLPKSSFVKLVIYDMLGREVEILVNQQLSAGTYKADWNASNYSSGVYFYKIEAGDFSDIRKMILIK